MWWLATEPLSTSKMVGSTRDDGVLEPLISAAPSSGRMPVGCCKTVGYSAGADSTLILRARKLDGVLESPLFEGMCITVGGRMPVELDGDGIRESPMRITVGGCMPGETEDGSMMVGGRPTGAFKTAPIC